MWWCWWYWYHTTTTSYRSMHITAYILWHVKRGSFLYKVYKNTGAIRHPLIIFEWCNYHLLSCNFYVHLPYQLLLLPKEERMKMHEHRSKTLWACSFPTSIFLLLSFNIYLLRSQKLQMISKTSFSFFDSVKIN